MKLEICECPCHIKGSGPIREDPSNCCQMQNEKYINPDKTFDWLKVGQALRKHNVKGDYTAFEKHKKNEEHK